MKRVATPFNERSWKLENISVATGSGKCVFYFFKNTILKPFYLGNNNFWQGRPVHSHPCLLCSLVIFVICLCFEVLGRQLDHQSDYAIAAFVNFSGNADFHLKHQICGLFHLFFLLQKQNWLILNQFWCRFQIWPQILSDLFWVISMSLF